jgi:hypothetical protein
MYFVSSLVLLHIGYQSQVSSADSTGRRVYFTLLLGIFLSGVTWSSSWAVRFFWETVTGILPAAHAGGVELLTFYTRDLRFGATLTALALVVGSWRRPRFREMITKAWTVVLVLLAFTSLLGPAITDFDVSPPKLSIPPGASSRAIYEVGEWARSETVSKDLFATNYYFEDTGGSVMELELATWSQREFLVLGPQITGRGETWTTEETRSRDTATEISDSFSHAPTTANCRQLREYGVKWYIVDTSKTSNRNWSICSSVAFSYDNFIVLSLDR